MEKNTRRVEKLLIGILFFITVTQFSTWGYQSVKYILGKIFNVEIVSTPFDTVIGIIAMASSALIFVAAGLWWKEKISAKNYFIIGSILFIIKNVLDIINEVVIFGIEHAGSIKTVANIETLAIAIGNEFFQLAFWVFIMVYFRIRISSFESGEIPQNHIESAGQTNTKI